MAAYTVHTYRSEKYREHKYGNVRSVNVTAQLNSRHKYSARVVSFVRAV
jgi:hypothetical protein